MNVRIGLIVIGMGLGGLAAPVRAQDGGHVYGHTSHLDTSSERFQQAAADQQRLVETSREVFAEHSQAWNVNSGFRATPPSAAHDRGAIDLPIPADRAVADAIATELSRREGSSGRVTVIQERVTPDWSSGEQGPRIQVDRQFNNGVLVREQIHPPTARGDHIHFQPAVGH